MSTSLLYQGFGLVGYGYVRTRYVGGAIIFSLKRKSGALRCAVCRSRNVVLRGTFARRFRTVPIGSKRVFLDLDVQRVECRRCREGSSGKAWICRSSLFLQSCF